MEQRGRRPTYRCPPCLASREASRRKDDAMSRLRFFFTLTLLLAPAFFTSRLIADEPESLHQRIDKLIAAAHPDYDKLAAENSADAEFFRRIHLDLSGAIPSAQQTRAFLSDATPSTEKRTKLIDQLLTSPQLARRLQYVFDEMLMERQASTNVTDAEWREYLRQSFLDNKPWDKFVSEILAADGVDPKLRPAAKFYLDRNKFSVGLITRDVGRVFLGVDLECAQCHDHPSIDGYLQRHYYGISAFLKRSYLFRDPKTKKVMLGEKAEGDVTFTSVFTNESGKTSPRLLDLPEIVDPAGMAKQYTVKPGKAARGVPKYSRRLQLANAMIDESNVAFRKNIVNRLWAVMLGRGLVEPLDMRHSANPPSHPAVLDLLASEFSKHKYDIRWLLRELALSESYQRSSRSASEANIIVTRQYAVGLLKPLSPEQLALSVMKTTGVTASTLAAQEAALIKKEPKQGPEKVKQPRWQEEALYKALKPHVDQFVLKFAAQGGQKTNYDATADQALFLLNGALVQSWLAPQAGNLTDRLQKIEDPTQLAEELYLSVLSRKPTATETTEITAYLTEVGDRSSVVQELTWALLSSAEFRFNH
jgi:hypothetical protein